MSSKKDKQSAASKTMLHAVGPPLASDSSGMLPATRAYPDGSSLGSARAASANSHRRLRHELSYPATAQWAFLTSTPQPLDSRRQHRPAQPSRPSTAREVPCESTRLPKRPATSRTIKTQLRQHEQLEILTPRTATVAIQEAIRRERDQEQYVNPLVGRSVEPRGQTGRKTEANAEGVDMNAIALLSRARGVTTASMNTTEQLRTRAFRARANGEYDQAIKFYRRLSTTRPSEVEAKFRLAVCLERTGQFAPALAAYKQVQKLSDGQHAFAYYNMGNLCMCAERVPQAIKYFSRAIAASKGKCTSSSKTRGLGASIGPTPVAFYRQRAAAYRKHGDFEKAAQDYVLLQRCAGAVSSSAPTEESDVYTADPLYALVKRAKGKSPRKIHSEDEADATEELSIVVDRNQHETEEPQTEEGVEDALTAWALQRSIAIMRAPPSDRTEGDLQYLVDFMTKRFAACAALHPDVCRSLCREIVLSPQGSLPARTPVFLEEDEDGASGPRDRSLYFLFQGRVSVSKTAGRMFQLSPQRPEQTQAREEDERLEQGDAWASPWSAMHPRVSPDWKQSQLELCELEHGQVFGHQGRFTDTPRTYSAVTSTSCVMGAVSWQQWRGIDRAQHEAERERAARFLAMTPAFHGVSAADIRDLAYRATFIKVVGSKAVCCEGQSVDGLLLVREGELCQFSPCGLRAPPDMSVSFALSGSLSEPQSARAFFTQLETAGDPLSFWRVNDAFHGFLPQNYVASKQRELFRLATTRVKVSNVRRASVMINCMGAGKGASTSEPIASSLRRGECFCVSSSWVPPRQSRQEKQQIRGTACAKVALVSVATAELLFLSTADLTQGLSVVGRSQLHRNLQDISLVDNTRKHRTDLKQVSRSRGPPGGRRSSNLLEQFVRDAHWSKFKEELVESVLHGRT